MSMLSTKTNSLTWLNVPPEEGQALPPYASEAAVCRHVENVLVDVVRAIQPTQTTSNELIKSIHFVSELSVFGNRADLWVVRMFGAPVGVVEVKKPDRKGEILNSPHVAGQLFDYMCRLRSFHGLREVFGIATTYRQWRVFWLPDTDSVTAAGAAEFSQPAAQAPLDKSTAMPPQPAASARDILPPPPTWARIDRDSTPEARAQVQAAASQPALHTPSPTGPEDRRAVCADETLEWNSPALVPVLASVLLKMMHARAAPPQSLIDLGRPYIKVTEISWFWTRLRVPLQLQYWSLPRHNDNATFLLLHHLGDGTYGRVWLASTLEGNACVLKFPKGDTALREECELWHGVWGVDGVRLVTLASKQALLMPYVRTATTLSPRTPEIEQAARAAVRRMAERGWCHDDLKWDHVGLYRTGPDAPLSAVLIDLGMVSMITSEPADSDGSKAREAAVARMLQALELRDINAPPSNLV